MFIRNHYHLCYLHCNTSTENNFSIHFPSIKLNYNCSLTNTSFNFISIPLPCILRILYIHVICTLQFKYSTWFWFFMIFLHLSWNGTNEKVGIGMCYKHEFSLFFFLPLVFHLPTVVIYVREYKILHICNSHFIAMKITLNES